MSFNKKRGERYPKRLEKETDKKKDNWKSKLEGKKNKFSKKWSCNQLRSINSWSFLIYDIRKPCR